jgi:hypothetical protein
MKNFGHRHPNDQLQFGLDPCAGHACDGCDICRSGVCCLTVRQAAGNLGSLSDGLDVMREAVAEDAGSQPTLADLIRADHTVRVVSDLLGAALPEFDELPEKASLPTRLAAPASAALPPARPSLLNRLNAKEKDHAPPARDHR